MAFAAKNLPLEAKLVVDDFSGGAYQYAGARPPLVSFIVVNYNYGRYLRQCVDTIFAQTYPFIECIVVDNKSTDESADVISSLSSTYPQLKIIHEPTNLGQSAACIDGYNLSRGHFVVFVDADDYYFDTFVETHLLVHMSSSQPVGFSSSDMIQIVDGTAIGTFIDIGPDELKWCIKIDLGLPPSFADICAKSQRSPVEAEILSVRTVDQRMGGWVWGPTSGTMYRRDALALFIDCKDLPSLRSSTDAFFNYAINALTGSILIEKPLAAYRIHGGNEFVRAAALRNLRNHSETADLAPLAAKLIHSYVIENFDRFSARLMDNGTLKQALKIYASKAAEIRYRRRGHHMRRAFGNAALRLQWQCKLGIFRGIFRQLGKRDSCSK